MFSIDMKIAGFDDELSDALKKEIIYDVLILNQGTCL